MFNPANMSAGAYVYTVSGTAPCTVETATVNVSINTPPNAGTDGSIALCSSGAAVSLFAQLGGTPDAGGTWSGPSNVNGGMINPATMNAGTYTYTVAGAAPCTDASANVTVTISTPPNAGADGSITLCSSGAAVSLFAQLGGSPDAGGTWSGPSNVNGGMFNPANMSAGAYVYTVSGTAPCTVETATVNVIDQRASERGNRWFNCALQLWRGRFTFRSVRRNARCRRNVERAEQCERRHDQPRNDERGHIHVHRGGRCTVYGCERERHRDHQRAARRWKRRIHHALQLRRGCFALRAAWWIAGCWRNLERTEQRERRNVQPREA
ncbi:MAG: hypothetical protein LKM36_06615 [Flavobacteriales bacterium]|nr:hypothetical protein [Flavobacteriales bacterium]